MHDLIIIGAGPAGLSAALYAGRFRLDTLMFEKMAPGGQIILSGWIENYPGFPGGIDTQGLIEKFRKQAEEAGIGIISEDALQITPLKNDAYSVKTDKKTYETRSVIVASGAKSKSLGIQGEDKLLGKGVSYCATCDGPFFKGKDIVVIGGGDRAIEEASFLAGYARRVTVVHRRQQLRASRILQEKVNADPKVSFVLDSAIEEIGGQGRVEFVKVKNIKTGQASELACQGVFIFVGIRPNTEFVKNLLNTDEAGFIITEQNLATSAAGIFACGDCRKKTLYQVVNACGEGAVAADSAYKYLLESGF